MIYSDFGAELLTDASSAVFLGKRIVWIFGNTPPWAIVTPDNSLFNSSSFLIANCKCLGMILDFLLSLAALPANSRISALKYSGFGHHFYFYLIQTDKIRHLRRHFSEE